MRFTGCFARSAVIVLGILAQASACAAEILNPLLYAEEAAYLLKNESEFAEILVPGDSMDERLFPVGRILVNRTTREGLVLACTRFDESGDCDRFRFFYYPNADQFRVSSALSREFELKPENSEWSEKKKNRELRSMIRKKSIRQLNRGTRIAISYATLITGVFGGALALRNYSAESIQYELFNAAIWVAGVAVIFAPFSLDWISPAASAASRAIVGHRLKRLNDYQEENFLIRHAVVNHRVFDRLKSHLKAGYIGDGFRATPPLTE